ncbi:MAG: hypothetical protein ABI837_04910 [Acidobacteriota bacterium]
MRRNLMALVGIIIVGVFVSACSLTTPHVSSHRSVGSPILAPSDPNAVVLLKQPPASPYETIGTIRVSWFGIRTDKAIARDVAIQTALRQEAAKLGADAVIDFVLIPRPEHYPSAVVGAVDPYAGQIEATAIRTKVRPQPPSGAPAPHAAR